jgi:RNA polymerase sigma-70 factor (ECF subfamily)
VEKCDFDAEYVQRLADGDPSVESHFTSYFGDLVRIKLSRRGWSGQDIEDVRQETFLRIFQTLRRGRGVENPERLGAFVNSVCNNVILEFCRLRARDGYGGGERDEPADTAINIHGSLVAEEQKRLVEKILAELPELDRNVLRMIFLEEAVREEVCKVMNVDRDYLRVLLHRARTRFRTIAAKTARAAAG